jgi:hypothetical protein
MIDYYEYASQMTMVCDICEYTDEVEGDWDACIKELKQKGWASYKKEDSNEWMHKCPTCVKGPSAEEDFTCGN